MILIKNLLMVNHTVVIASVAACLTRCSRFDLLSSSIDFNVKFTVILKKCYFNKINILMDS